MPNGGDAVSRPLYQAKAEFFKTLGHPARIRILELLSERDHAVHELLNAIAIEPSNSSTKRTSPTSGTPMRPTANWAAPAASSPMQASAWAPHSSSMRTD